MAKREFLQLSHVYDPAKISIAYWFMSEKLDGMRAFWDGGITRGMYADSVPFANVEKDNRLINRVKATGLWSRYGKVIQAPDYWLDKLPNIALDGELYIGRGRFQETVSITKTHVGGSNWNPVKFVAFDSPPLHVVLSNGEINNTNFKKKLVSCLHSLPKAEQLQRPPTMDFAGVSRWLRHQQTNEVFNVHDQEQLPTDKARAESRLNERLEYLLSVGAEGIILRHPTSPWVPQRTRTSLKYKPINDAEATVIGYTWGRETDLGSKLLGLMGALVLSFNGKTFELSGFTEAERVMCKLGAESPYQAALNEGYGHPGEPVTKGIHNPKFPIGSKVTFKYREMTDAGLPKEARYWRKWSE